MNTVVDHSPFPARFEVVRRLGSGSMGVVYQLKDTATGSRVAGKILHGASSDEIFRLKQEFRAACGIRHPNLVRLHELFVTPARQFFTMELVDGDDIAHHVRSRYPRPDQRDASDWFAVRRLIEQLVSAVSALHDAGVAHRDVKPANVMVEPNGRVVVLDFGFATRVANLESLRSNQDSVVGTLAYLPPEQLMGAAPDVRGDWYAVGTLIWELCAGALPPRTLGSQVPPLAEHAPHVPDDLTRAVDALLAADPSARPDADQLFGLLEMPAGKERATRPRVAFQGRRRLLDDLVRHEREGRGSLRVVELLGPSGLGKSEVGARLCERLANEGVRVLQTRCHPTEHVAFNAIDGLVDAIARGWPEQVDVRALDAGDALSVFPVLGRIQDFGAETRTVAPVPNERRRRAVRCVRQLLRLWARHQRILVWLDDVHWADADSLDALTGLFSGSDAPPVFLLATSRTPFSQRLPWGVRALSITLDPLSDDDVTNLVRSIDGGLLDEDTVRLVVEGSKGNPYVAIEMATDRADSQGPRSLQSVLRARLDALAPELLQVVRYVCSTGRPIPLPVLLALVEVGYDALLGLVEQRLVELIPSRTGLAVAPYHGAVREAACAPLDDETVRALNRQLAVAYGAAREGFGEARIDCLVDAGEEVEAAGEALQLARSAYEASAFHLSARLFERALALGSERAPRWRVLAGLADAWVGAGSPAAAATAYTAASEALSVRGEHPERRLGFERRAAIELLRGGVDDQGLVALKRAFRTAGLRYPSHWWSALGWVFWGRFRDAVHGWWWGRQPYPVQGAIDPTDREGLELLWGAGQALTFTDLTRASALQAWHGLRARRLRDAGHLARSLSTRAMLAAWEGGDATEVQVRERLAEAERLARRSADSGVQAQVELMHAVVAALYGRWSDAIERSSRGDAYCASECTGATWERASFQQNQLVSMSYGGLVQEGAVLTEQFVRDARGRGDLFAARLIPGGPQSLCTLAARGADAVEALLADELGSEARGSGWYGYLDGYARVQMDLYRGDSAVACERADGLVRALRRGWLFLLPSIRFIVYDVLARAHLLEAEQSQGPHREAHLRRAEQAAGRIRPRTVGWFAPYVDRTLGAVALLRGERELAERRLEAAAVGYTRLQMPVHAAAVRLRGAEVLGDDAGVVCDELVMMGVVDPVALARAC